MPDPARRSRSLTEVTLSVPESLRSASLTRLVNAWFAPRLALP